MTEFALGTPHADELADAIAALEDMLRLDTLGEVALPPYLRQLLSQLGETLAVTPSQPVIDE